MKATIKKVSMKHITTQSGKKFDKVVITCDVVTDERGTLKTYNSEMNPDYAKRYFRHCGLTSKDLPGMPCDVILRRRAFTDKDGRDGAVTEIRWLNMLDKEGKPIIMPKEETSTEDLGF